MHSGKLTKIISTLGPASNDVEIIKQLITSGTNIFRLNLKHNTIDWHVDACAKIKEVSSLLNIKIGVMIDLQGPEVTVQTFEQKDVIVNLDKNLLIGAEFSDQVGIVFKPSNISKQLGVGDVISVDDGVVELEIIASSAGTLEAKVVKGTVISNGKGVGFKNKKIQTEVLDDENISKLKHFEKVQPDFVALSFVKTASDIELLRSELKKLKINCGIVAKIETFDAIKNLPQIAEVSDAVMIARGDLGVEVSLEKLTFYQKEIIIKCRSRNCPVIVATQMLESMVQNPYPTRAEVSDISNAVLDGADALMLSGETAIGTFPVETVKTMHRVISFNEKVSVIPEVEPFKIDQTYSIAKAALDIIELNKDKINKVLIATESGKTARVFSTFRPKIPIIGLTQNDETLNILTITYGVLGHKIEFSNETLVDITSISKQLQKDGILQKGETVLVIHGKRWKDPGNTSSLFIFQVS